MSNKLPNDLINHLKDDPHFNYQAFIAVHDEEEKTSSIRLNNRKKIAIDAFVIDKAIPWCNEGYYLKQRPIFTLDPLFHAGCYYSQEASSMFLDHAIRQLQLDRHPLKALDLCAAPGGKSTLINSALHEDSLVVANEIIKTRVTVLQDNLMKWGHPNTVVTNNDPSSFERLPGYFDFLVIDAPCSGSGMFHKDHDAIDEWSLANVKLCSERQQRILAAALPSLKTDGYLFYSTCSYSRAENEEMVDWIIDQFGFETVNIPVDERWGIDVSESMKHKATGYRFYPHRVAGEGFFCAVLKKKAEQATFSMKRVKFEKSTAPQQIAKQWIDDQGLYTFAHNDNLHVFPKAYEQDLTALQNVLYLKNAGTQLGKLAGKDLIPSHDLALSTLIRADIQGIDLDLEGALNFLRKETINADLNTDNLKGWVLMRYKNINLGWIKAMPNRINNYYPKELRIVNL
ncbi:methyltransferase RsmF C-terminal domain-like protein [Sphingobacterium rhinopitheci]|uniref:methyltransferase RsmF C-terminal domain-like protein n=1 Tax=Sphingobacterium rhinopitheci TaxID=2781960 RepID=UPI001F517D88|nr:RNA methyltransferase [Sphingobacterium rhinopitheci]MCI0921509.1 RNA methyltransferase [Sphingobacterium rhinopitheci]